MRPQTGSSSQPGKINCGRWDLRLDGFFHQPRSAAPPFVLDLMEIFQQVWLSDAGRRKAIALFEERLNESYKHPHTGQSLCYARMVELEARLLEKEWSGSPGLYGKMRLR